MLPYPDSRILQFDDDLQGEARSVLSRSPEPQNAFEVAVIMETLGHTDATARARGYDDLFDLARHLYEMLDDMGVIHPADRRGEQSDPSSAQISLANAIGLFIGQSLPWLTAFFLLMAVGTGFWSSSIFTPTQSASMVLALSAGLVSSAFFTFPFARRATFYRLQGNRSLVAWTARWFLGSGAVGCVVAVGGLYLLLGRVLGAYTPATTRAFFEMGVAIAFLQLALVPLYALRAFRWMAATTSAGVAVLVLGLVHVDHGIYTGPFAVIDVQLASIGAMVGVALTGCWWMLRRGEGEVAVPRIWAVVRSTAPYALYGAGFFLLVLTGGFVAGGIWGGAFHYVRDYAVITGTALLLLLPLFGYTTFAGERSPDHVRSLTRRLTVAEAGDAISAVLAWYRRQLGTLLLVGLVAGALMIGLVGLLNQEVGVAGLIWRHLSLYAGVLCSDVAVGAGVLSSQTLFALSRPAMPAAGAWAGIVTSFGSAGLLSLAYADTSAAVLGLLLGTGLFAVVTGRAATHALKRFDRRYYSAL